jgi:hypothetical protein
MAGFERGALHQRRPQSELRNDRRKPGDDEGGVDDPECGRRDEPREHAHDHELEDEERGLPVRQPENPGDRVVGEARLLAALHAEAGVVGCTISFPEIVGE